MNLPKIESGLRFWILNSCLDKFPGYVVSQISIESQSMVFWNDIQIGQQNLIHLDFLMSSNCITIEICFHSYLNDCCKNEFGMVAMFNIHYPI